MKKSDRTGFTERVLMSLQEDVKDLNETARRLTIQIEALAKEYEVGVPDRPAEQG